MNNTTIDAHDNDIYWITVVSLLNRSVSQYGLGLIWLIGNIGSVFSCIVFSQPTFRNSACSIYFTASSVAQFFTFNFALFTRMLEFGYNVQAVNTFLWFCKIRYYLFYIFVAVPRYDIILASIDRYFASSRDARRRQWSSPKIAFRLVIGNIVFWTVLYIQVIVFYEIDNGTCQPRPGSFGVYYSIYITIDSGILPLSFMIIFGLLTINNSHQTRRRVQLNVTTVDALPVRVGGMANKEAHLHKMLANQIILFIVLNIWNPCYLIYRAVTLNWSKSPVRRTVELFINNMTYVLMYLGFALTCINFLVSSEMFRREFLQVIRTKILRQPPPPSTARGTTPRITFRPEVNGQIKENEERL